MKSLGNSLLSAIEKEDGEALAVLRARHERVVMEMVEHVKYGQLQEAIKAREGLLQSLALAVQRYTYYERQLGKKAEEIEKAIPELDELDKDSLRQDEVRHARARRRAARRSRSTSPRTSASRAARSSAATKRRSSRSSRTARDIAGRRGNARHDRRERSA